MSDTPPAGWYPDPENSGQQRYWNGTAWTEHTAEGGPQAAAGPQTGGGPYATTSARTSSPGGPDTWTWQSILATIFCCNVLGVAGVLNAGRAEQALKVGDLAAAERYAAQAKKWTLWSAGLIVVLALLYFVFIVLVVGGAGFSEFQNL